MCDKNRRSRIGISAECILVVVMTAMGLHAQAAELSPIGRWKTIDDDGKTAKSIVEIYQKGNKLYGKIIELINPEVPHPVCDKCEGKLKGKPLIGMVIMWGLERDDDEWSGGRIVDPNNGEEYSCKIALEDGGKKLKVRGFVGISLLGRSQHWLRAAK